jgi:hypothetical protein
VGKRVIGKGSWSFKCCKNIYSVKCSTTTPKDELDGLLIYRTVYGKFTDVADREIFNDDDFYENYLKMVLLIESLSVIPVPKLSETQEQIAGALVKQITQSQMKTLILNQLSLKLKRKI